MTAFGAEILIYDMRRLADKEMNALDLACRTLCVSATTVPPIEADKDISRHVLAYQKFLIPLTTTSLVKIFMHVRAGDNLWGSEAPQPKNVFESRGIEMHEVSSMVEARTLIERFLESR